MLSRHAAHGQGGKTLDDNVKAAVVVQRLTPPLTVRIGPTYITRAGCTSPSTGQHHDAEVLGLLPQTRGLCESKHGCSECDGARGRESSKADALFEQQT